MAELESGIIPFMTVGDYMSDGHIGKELISSGDDSNVRHRWDMLETMPPLRVRNASESRKLKVFRNCG